ncbi:hypothetical protein BDZ91DRAFT_790936 [Kalaharituber pfeilii]|nr:hypothetical protein BDZ91DRAFT_790936 [Kalaharituber pfeilii]
MAHHCLGSGYQNSPVRGLERKDMRCNILGDIPTAGALKALPNNISPNPPRANSWVKIFEDGEYAANKWAVVPKLVTNRCVHSVRIPPGVKIEQGVQPYMECIQIEVTGSGTFKLPEGNLFPGAYSYFDPGIVYSLHYTQTGTLYNVPGPTVWSGADPSVINPPFVGRNKGPLTVERWSSWAGSDKVLIRVGADGVTTKSPASSLTAPPSHSTGTSSPPAAVTTSSAPPTSGTVP